MAVYAYIRFSSERQASGDSVQRQTDAINAYCATNNLSVDEWVHDHAKSAFSGSNRKSGKLSHFLARVISGEIETGSTLIVESVDRLSREEVMTALDTYTTLINAGLTIVTTMDGQSLNRTNYNKQWTNLIMTLSKMAVANEESEKKSVRALASWEKHRADPSPTLPRNRPSWIDRNGELIEDRVRIVERMFAEILAGHGFAKIAKGLNEDGVPTWGIRKKSQPMWRDGTVSQIVRGRTVIGDYQPQKLEDGKKVDAGPVFENFYKPAIDPATYHRAQAVIDGRSFNADRGRKGNDFTNLFYRLAKCAHCRSAMVIRAGQGVKYLTCSGAKRGTCHNRIGTEYDGFERLVLQHVTEFDVGHRAPDTSGLVNEIAATKFEIDRQTKRIDVIAEQLLDMQSETLRRKLTESEAALSELRVQLRDLESERAKIESRPPAATRQEEIRKLIADMNDPTKDRYAIRSRLNMAMRDIIDAMIFNEHRVVRVSVLNHLSTYSFTATGTIKHAKWSVLAIRAAADFDDLNEFAAGDPERMSKIDRVLAAR